MPNVNKASAFILSVLTLLAAGPVLAQNQGVRGMGDTRTRGPGQAQTYSAPTRAYSAPTRAYSAPTTRSAPTRSYSAPRNSNRSYSPPLTRQSVSIPTTRTSNSTYRTNTIPSAYTVNRATYQANPTATNVNIGNSTVLSNGAVRGYSPMTATRSIPAYAPGANGAGTAIPISRPAVQTSGPGYNTNSYYTYTNRNRDCAPRYRDCYDNSFYSNYNCRSSYRYYQPCYYPFLSYGFFVSRPYSYYDYARIDYAQPFVYGDDAYYRSAPVIDNQVASTQPTAPVSMEQEMLSELSSYVDSHSKGGHFQVADPAFGNQMWNLDLSQAPAVYSIDPNHYTVVSGFEGTLGENTIPSAVGMEFFVAREGGRWAIKQAWIVSANGIPRAKKFQSPAYPQVRTWQADTLCPFSGKPMVPISESGTMR